MCPLSGRFLGELWSGPKPSSFLTYTLGASGAQCVCTDFAHAVELAQLGRSELQGCSPQRTPHSIFLEVCCSTHLHHPGSWKSGLGHFYHRARTCARSLAPEDWFLGSSGIEASRKWALCSRKCLLGGKGVRDLGCEGSGVKETL